MRGSSESESVMSSGADSCVMVLGCCLPMVDRLPQRFANPMTS